MKEKQSLMHYQKWINSLAISVIACLMIACSSTQEEQAAAKSVTSESERIDHTSANDDHQGHGHSTDDHEAHDHSAHDHSTKDHVDHNHHDHADHQQEEKLPELSASGNRPPIDLVKFKASPWLDVTSGIVPEGELNCPLKGVSGGFYGFYILLDKEKHMSKVGVITIHNSGKDGTGWDFINDTDQFVGIETNSSRVVLWDKLKVGMPFSEALEFLGVDPATVKVKDFFEVEYEGVYVMIRPYEGKVLSISVSECEQLVG